MEKTSLVTFLETKLSGFRNCFQRSRPFRWFVTVIVAFMLRTDHLGVTSFVRALELQPKSYVNLLHFFHSDAVNQKKLRDTLCKTVLEDAHLFRTSDKRILLIGDGCKISLEGKHMPGVKKHHQESENSSKGEWIWGHMFGGLSVVTMNDKQSFATPLGLSIQDGLKETSDWENSEISNDSHPIQMAGMAYDAAKILGSSILALDRYFLSMPFLMEVNRLNSQPDTGHLLEVITRAKSNIKAFEPAPVVTETRRGRPRKKGATVKLKDLFESEDSRFVSAKAQMYGNTEDVRYLVKDLLWGQGLYQEIRFVLVSSDRGKMILVSTDLTLDPVEIIEIYARRFKIETMFRQMKQEIGAFGYHFWTSSQPKLNRFSKEKESPLAQVQDSSARSKILSTVRATELFVQCACTATALVHMISLNSELSGDMAKKRFLRTVTDGHVSEATILNWMRNHFFRLLLTSPNSDITKIIQSLLSDDCDRMVS